MSSEKVSHSQDHQVSQQYNLSRLLLEIEGLIPNERRRVYRQHAVLKLKQHLNLDINISCSIISEEETAQGLSLSIETGGDVWAVGIPRQANLIQAIEKNPSLLHDPNLFFLDIKNPIEITRLGAVNDFNPELIN